jgi:flavin-dependent dehydrogenase
LTFSVSGVAFAAESTAYAAETTLKQAEKNRLSVDHRNAISSDIVISEC